MTLVLHEPLASIIRFSVAGYVYILASRRNGTLYIGATTDLP